MKIFIMRTNKAIIRFTVTLTFVLIYITGFSQKFNNTELQFTTNTGNVYNTKTWRENTGNGHILNPSYRYASLSIAPKRLKFIGLNVFTNQMTYDLEPINITPELQNADIFTANGLESLTYGIRPFLYLDSRSWRVQIQADIWSSTTLTPESYFLEGVNSNDMFIRRELIAEEQTVAKNIVQNFANTDLTFSVEYRLNENLGINAKVNTASFNYETRTKEIIGSDINEFSTPFDVTTIQYGVGLTWTLNSHHNKPWQPRKYNKSIETEMNRPYLPKKQTLNANIVHPKTGKKVVIDLLPNSTKSTAYFSFRSPETGYDTIIGLPTNQIDSLELENKNGKLTLKTNDFLASLGQTTDLVMEQPTMKKIDDKSVFYEFDFQLSNGEIFRGQALTDPLPLLWVLGVAIAGGGIAAFAL